VVLAAATCLAGTACSATSEPPIVETRDDGIFGGQLAPNEPNVFVLSNGCTSTLIAPHTLLTAAHCVTTPAAPPVWASNGIDQDAGTRYAVVLSVTASGIPRVQHPDLGLVLLDSSPPVTPARWLDHGPLPPLGTVVRHVGYGFDEAGIGGTRRMVELPITAYGISPEYGVNAVTGGDGTSICFGDSGGPAFGRDAQGELVVAVHSHLKSLDCGGESGSTLVFPYALLIADWLEAHEAPSCASDHRCVPGCTPVDLDCSCGADQRCGADCLEAHDPDCAPRCEADNICRPLSECPVDLDCMPLGSACAHLADRCASGLCSLVGDGLNPTMVCTQVCSAQTPCPAGFDCDTSRGSGLCARAPLEPLTEDSACSLEMPCAHGLTCARVGELPRRCRPTCYGTSECKAGSTCDVAQLACLPDAVLPPMNVTRTGCAALPGRELALLAFALILRRPRRRSRPPSPRCPWLVDGQRQAGPPRSSVRHSSVQGAPRTGS
jgi:hypothetical protein